MNPAVGPDSGKPLSDAGWLQEVQQAFFTQRCLHAVARLGVADHLAAAPLVLEDLAQRSNANADALYRVMRFLVSRGVFDEPSPRTFALNPRAALLRSDAPGSARWLFMHDLPSRAAAGILHSVQTGEPAFQRLQGKTVWEHLQGHPEENDWFNRHMRAQALSLAMPVVTGYDWSASNVVVDVGGGTGLFLTALLERQPHLRGVLVDQPHVVDGVRPAERLEIVPGDFFGAIDARGDTYVLSRILHDWEDAQATRILRSVRAAMPAGAKLLILEMVVPEDQRPHPSKMLDIAMMVQFGGRERTEEEFRRLLAAGAFALQRVVPTPGPTCVVEAKPL